MSAHLDIGNIGELMETLGKAAVGATSVLALAGTEKKNGGGNREQDRHETAALSFGAARAISDARTNRRNSCGCCATAAGNRSAPTANW